VKKYRKRAASGSSPVVNRAVKARYGDPEDAAAIARDILRQKHAQGRPLSSHAGKSPTIRQSSSLRDSDGLSSRPSSDSELDDASEGGQRIGQSRVSGGEDDSSSSLESKPRRLKKRRMHSASAQRQDVHGNASDVEMAPSPAFIVELIKKQNEQFETLLERFRRDRANDRKQFFDSVYAAIQARLPADNTGPSHLERLVERQGRSLSNMLQRLQTGGDASDWPRNQDRVDQVGDWNRGGGQRWPRADPGRNEDWGRYRDWERDSVSSDWNRRRDWDWTSRREWGRDSPWYGMDQSTDRPPSTDGAPSRDGELNRDAERDTRYTSRAMFPPDESRW